MSQTLDFEKFLTTYVNTNVALGSKPYDEKFLAEEVLGELIRANKECFSQLGFHIIVAASCAMKRADLVPPLFQAAIDRSPGDSEAILERFSAVRETINIIWPFVGVPQVIPACLGLSGYLQFRSIRSPLPNRLRQDFGSKDVQIGTETRQTIYKASANSEVFEMLDTYFGDFAYTLNGVGFGYNIGRVTNLGFSLAEAELILTSALIALGATRQAGSHIKACIAFGYSESDLDAVIQALERLADWQGIELPSKKKPIAVRELAEQARKALNAAKH